MIKLFYFLCYCGFFLSAALGSSPYEKATLESPKNLETFLQQYAGGTDKSNTPASIFAGYVKGLYNSKRTTYEDMLEKPTLESWTGLIETCNYQTKGLFKEYLPQATGNFSIKMLNLLHETLKLMGEKKSTWAQNIVSNQEKDLKGLTSAEKTDLRLFMVDEEERVLMSIHDAIEGVAHKILCGAFGFRKSPATEDEAKDITSFLIKRGRDAASRGNAFQDKIMPAYTFSSKAAVPEPFKTQQSFQNYLDTLKFILSSSYWATYGNHTSIPLYDAKTQEAINKPIQNKKISLDILKKPGVTQAFQQHGIPLEWQEDLSKPKLSDLGFTPQWHDKYEYYVQSPQKFWEDFKKDVETYADNYVHKDPLDTENLTTQQFVLNAASFLYFVQVIPRLIEDGVKFYRGDFPNKIYLTTGNKDKEVYKKYKFKDDFEIFSTTLKTFNDQNGKPLQSQIYIRDSIKAKDLAKFDYDIDRVHQGLKSFYKHLWEELVYGYIFAKSHNINLTTFFARAFPMQLHCTASLSTKMQSWINNEKKTLNMGNQTPQKIAQTRLDEDVGNVIKNHNLFIGSVIETIIDDFMISKIYEIIGNVTNPEELQNPRKNLKDWDTDYNFKAASLTDQFTTDITKIMTDVAKSELPYWWEGLKHCADKIASIKQFKFTFPDVSALKDPHRWVVYTTTDKNLYVFIKVPQEYLEQGSTGIWHINKKMSPPSLQEIEGVEIYAMSELKSVATSVYDTLETYLEKRYNLYINTYAPSNSNFGKD